MYDSEKKKHEKCEPEAKSRKLSTPLPREEAATRQQAAAVSKFVPKSLSLVEMLKLGKVVHQT